MPSGLLVEGVIRRPLASLAVLVAGALAIGGAASGPMLSRATEQLALTQTLRSATAAEQAVSVSSLPSSSQASALSIRVDAVSQSLDPPSAGKFFGNAAVSVSTTERVPATTTGTGLRSVVGWFGDDGCARLRINAGRCPSGADEVALSARDARSAKLDIGDTITINAKSGTSGSGSTWRIVGVYGMTTTEAGFTTDIDAAVLPSGDATVTADPLLVDQQVMQSELVSVPQAITVSRPLRSGALQINDVRALRSTLAAVHDRVAVAAKGWAVTDPVGRLLDDVDSQRRIVAITVPIVGIQLVLIAWIGLAVLVRSISLSRAEEWTLGQLRGLPRRQVVTSALGGTVVMLLVAAPAGLLLAAGLTKLLTRTLIGEQVQVEPWRGPVLLAVALAVAGSIVAAAGSAWQALKMPVASLLHRSSTHDGDGRLQLVAEAGIAAVAAAACYQVLAGGLLGSAGQSELGLLAPALAAVTIGLILTRAARVVLRRYARRRPRRLSTLLSTRRLAYAPGVLRGAVVLIAGAALASSAFNLAATAQRNREIRAGQEVGADAVLTVTTQPGTDFVEAVRQADPSGRTAMAAVESTIAGTPLLAVDASRYAGIAEVDPRWSNLQPRYLAGSLSPAHASSIELIGTQLRLELTDAAIGTPQIGGNGTLAPPAPGVTVAVGVSALVQDAGSRTEVDLGVVSGSTAQLAGSIPCEAGCRLLGLRLNGDGKPYNAALTVTGLSTDTTTAARYAPALKNQTQWSTPIYLGSNPETAPTALTSATGDGLRVSATDLVGVSTDGPSIRVNDTPSVLPVVIGARTSTVQLSALAGGFSGTGLDGQQVAMSAVGVSRSLPRLGDDGILLDLDNALLSSDPAARSGLTEQVWLAPHAPAALRDALARNGVTITAEQTKAAQLSELSSLAPARAITLASFTSAAGLGLAVLVAAAGLLLSSRTRLYELASMRAVGIRAAVLRRAVLIEMTALLGIAILVGAATGVLTSAATVTNLPLYGGGGGPPLDLQPVLPVAATLTAIAISATLALSTVCSVGLVRAAVPSRLRESLR